MGSKRSMLQNGLGQLICDHAANARRVVDLFCGAASVAWFAAENTQLPVIAVDLQAYAAVLAEAVIARNEPLEFDFLKATWLTTVKRLRGKSQCWCHARELEQDAGDVAELVKKARALCAKPSRIGPIWTAYGGHYFSPTQALTIDYLMRYLPKNDRARPTCLASIIVAASSCVAAPGHTAQPFQPTVTAAPFLLEAWKRDPLLLCEKALAELCPRHAKIEGRTVVGDALEVARHLRSDDLVVVDPPYSGVQYSRFYHVLETIARGKCSPVEGAGRYPPFQERPQSAFSNKGQSKAALKALITALAHARATVIFTFPDGECTNGLSGKDVTDVARAWYDVEEKVVKGRFSTLGGNNTCRAARNCSTELLLLMKPKSLTVG